MDSLISIKNWVSPKRIQNACEYTFWDLQYLRMLVLVDLHTPCIRCSVSTYGWHVYVLFGKFGTRLLFFLGCHVYKSVNSDWKL